MAYTFQTEVSDGIRTLFAVAFEILSEDYVYVYSGEHPTYATQLSYRWADASTIELTNLSEVPAGTSFTIRRIVPRDRLLQVFENKSIRAGLIDRENYHALYFLQEVADGFVSITDTAIPTNLNMLNNRIVNLAPAEDPKDAINLQQAQVISAGQPGRTGVARVITVPATDSADRRNFDLKQIAGLETIVELAVLIQGVEQEYARAYNVSGSIVSFTEELDADVRVTFKFGITAGDEIPTAIIRPTRTFHVAKEDQREFQAPAHNAGVNELLVFINGTYQCYLDEAFEETGVSIILASPLGLGEKVEIWKP